MKRFSTPLVPLLIVLLHCSTSVFAQRFKDDLRISANYLQGVIVPEYNNFTYVVNDYARGVELNFRKETTGKDAWERAYHYPAYGISLSYSSLGNNMVMGHEYSVFPYCVFHLFSANRFHLDQQIGLGLSYTTKKLDLTTNYLAVATGSHVNAHFTLRLGGTYQLTNKLNLQTGLAFHHFSNGNLREPNLGVNCLGVYGGVGWLLGDALEKDQSPLDAYERSRAWEVTAAIGGKHTRALDAKFYKTASLAIEHKWKPRRAFHLGLAADFFYDSSTEIEMRGKPFKPIYQYRTGIHFSQELVYKRFSIMLQEGIYIGLTDHVSQHVMYNRGVVRYRISDHFIGSLSLKSHLHILDYPEFGLTYTWQ